MTKEKEERVISFAPKVKDKFNRNNKDICEDYLRSPQDFLIYQDSRLLFDSSVTDRSNIVFHENSFTLYGKMFTYKGIRIMKKLE